MGNTHVKPHPRQRNKKQVHWKAAARPQPPGKPQLTSETESTPDLVTICWSKPQNDGGSPISGYLVEHRRTGSPHWVRSIPILVQNPEVIVSGLEPGWRYQFRISAQNAVGISDPSELSEPITVTLQRSAITAPRFTQDVKETTALENEKSEFIVHFLGQPPPRVCWFKDEFEIFSSRRIRIITENDKSTLTIHQCSLSDEGEIKCTATNRAGHVSSKAKLTIEAPPSIRLPRNYEEGLLFDIGEVIRLKVSTAGRPTPLVLWSHNGESIRNNDRCEVESDDKTSILKIIDAVRGDRGEYQVKAVNKLGEDIQSFLVTVTDKPSPPSQAQVVMALGRSVTLTWSTPKDDGGCKIGNYIIEYYRLGWNVWLKAATSRQVTTILGDLIEGSEYKFRVKAESPYGISEPSEETEVVFIPDPKRGILQPPTRGRSQPKELNGDPITPVARRKHKNRSQSSSRLESSYGIPNQTTTSPSIPIRPERSKIKSPPKTPEASPLVKKRAVDAKVNREIFERSDRSSMARELSYGSPEIKMKKLSLLNAQHSNGSEVSRTPSPNGNDGHKVYKVKIEQPFDNDVSKKKKSPSPEQRSTKANNGNLTSRFSPENYKQKSPREINENFTGSSEFMLMLYPGENEKGKSRFDFDSDSVPPPMSLSAPELGSDSPIFGNLKKSASSTELLHEKAMMRLYEAAEAEEKEMQKQSQISENDIPKIQINSKDNQKIVGLERQQSLRRRLSAGGLVQQHVMWSQRRHTLVSPVELKDKMILEEKLKKFPHTLEEKRDSMMQRQRSESEEMEEKLFENIRKKMDLTKQSSTESREINIADEEKWEDDYVSSTDDSESSEEDDDVRDIQKRYKKYSHDDDGEQTTYHPRGMNLPISNDREPFVILTKKKEPPSPDFVPKPILKKIEHEKDTLTATNSLSPSPNPRSRSHSPLPPNSTQKSPSFINTPQSSQFTPNNPQRSMSVSNSPQKSPIPTRSPLPPNIPQRSRSQSIAGGSFTLPMTQKHASDDKPITSRPRSFSLIPQQELSAKKVTLSERPLVLEKPNPYSLMHSISAVATISGITAASIVIPDRLLERRKDAEEAKVVVDHYGDIVKSYGGRRKSNPQIILDRNTLKKVAEEAGTQKNMNNATAVEPNKHEIQSTIPAMKITDDGSKNQEDGESKNAHIQLSGDKNEINYNHDESTKHRLESSRDHNVINKELQRSLSKSSPKVEPENKSGYNFHKPTSNLTKISDVNRDQSERTMKDTTRKYSALPDTAKKGRRTSPSPVRHQRTRPSFSDYTSNEVSSAIENYNLPLTDARPGRRRTSPSPIRNQFTKIPPTMNYPSRRSTPSPMGYGYHPQYREIMTQTPEGMINFDNNRRTSSPFGTSQRQEELLAAAEVKVHRFVDYLTDLAMFAVACWLYLFDNELLAVPVLLVMVYRQLQVEISRRIPKWLLDRLKRRNKK
ncbi:hypothetical protein JTB14_005304 [Gonioctena quinquepunctata]|nr:hypothetical protein JTB14_005304 [Gonioctena quinquepunctata]